MERIKQALTLSGQKYGALVLDLHCNMFGPTALFLVILRNRKFFLYVYILISIFY